MSRKLNVSPKTLIRKNLPYLLGIIVFVIITIVYFYPALEGKEIRAGDLVNVKGMSKEIVDYRKATGEEALWTNNMFGGMPAYQISIIYSGNLMRYVNKVIKFGYNYPLGMTFMYFLGFFILLLVLRVNPWLSIAGAIAFAFSSYFFIILEAGHTSKASAIGYMAPVLAGVILAYRGKYLMGGLITAIALSLEILSGHPQITYYLMLMIIALGIIEFIGHYKDKQLAAFFKATAVLVVAATLAVLTHAGSLWGIYEYSKYSIRGKSELSHSEENRTSGLDKDYATAWSYGKVETFNLLIPNLYGGSSHGELSKFSQTYQVLRESGVPNTNELIKQMPVYWGPQPFTSGPVYLGAIVVFLFVLSLFIVKGPIKWWAVAITILSILLAWGKNLMWLTDLFLDYFPLYNKFRTVSMILVMAELTIPLMAILGLQRILEWEIDKKKLITYGKYSLIITGGVLLFFSFFAGSLFSFNSPNDAASGLPEWLMAALKEDRKALLQRDVMRSLVFILITSALLWAYVAGKLKKVHVLIILPLLFLADMWPVNKRYLNNDDFVRQSVAERPFQATAADQAILEDSKLYYRVFNLTEALDKSARTSYFHKNIGGYHGAKLRRYQEMIDFPLRAERNKLVSVLNSQATMEDIHQTLESMPATRMLNTRYFILNNDSEPLFNPFALGNAWFVSKVEVVNNADEEIAAISNLDPKREAIVDKRFSSYLDAHPFQNSNAGKIRLTDYRPNRLVYQYDSPANQFAVFSEIFYDKGWKAIIDGEEVPHIRVNYILRGMVLPAGEHEIEFVFEPKSYYVGEKVSLVSSLIILLLLSGYVVGRLMKSKRS